MKKFPDESYPEDKFTGWFSGEDTTCGVICECGYGLEPDQMELWCYQGIIVRCPLCGRGYQVEFVVWQYEKDEEAEPIG